MYIKVVYMYIDILGMLPFYKKDQNLYLLACFYKKKNTAIKNGQHTLPKSYKKKQEKNKELTSGKILSFKTLSVSFLSHSRDI